MPLLENINKFPHNEHQMKRYLKFIEMANGSGDVKHHILPRSMFPEFANLKDNPWNECKITERQHFIAHLMLVRVFDNKEMRYAFNMMSNFSSNTSRLYHFEMNKFKNDLREDIKNRPQFSTHGITTVIDKDGNRFSCSTEHPKYLSGEWVHFAKGIKKDYPTTKGYVTVKDNDGNTFNVSLDDERYLSGELKHISKGILREDISAFRRKMVMAKDINGNVYQVTKEEFSERDDLYGIRKDLSKVRRAS